MAERAPADVWAQILAAAGEEEIFALSVSSQQMRRLLHREALDAAWIQVIRRAARRGMQGTEHISARINLDKAMPLEALAELRTGLAAFFRARAYRPDPVWRWFDAHAPQIVARDVLDSDFDRRTGALVYLAGGEVVVRQLDGARVSAATDFTIVAFANRGAVVRLQRKYADNTVVHLDARTLQPVDVAEEPKRVGDSDWSFAADAAHRTDYVYTNVRTGATFRGSRLDVEASRDALVVFDQDADAAVAYVCDVNTGARLRPLRMPEDHWPCEISGRTLYTIDTESIDSVDMDTGAVTHMGPRFGQDQPYIVDGGTWVDFFMDMVVVSRGVATYVSSGNIVSSVDGVGRRIIICVKREFLKSGTLMQLDI